MVFEGRRGFGHAVSSFRNLSRGMNPMPSYQMFWVCLPFAFFTVGNAVFILQYLVLKLSRLPFTGGSLCF